MYPGCRDISAVNCSRTCACMYNKNMLEMIMREVFSLGHLLPIPIFYSDIFPNSGYPKYEPMPDDLAQFVSFSNKQPTPQQVSDSVSITGGADLKDSQDLLCRNWILLITTQ